MYFRNSVSHLRAKCSREGAEIAELALNLHAPMVVLLPAFSGMFVALTLTTSLWSQAEWDTDAASMRLAGFTTLIIPHTGKQLSAPTALCPQGTFETWYPVSPAAFNGTGAACFTEVGDVKAEGGTLGNVLRAAKRYNLTVSLGLMFAPAEHGFPSQHRNGTYRNWGDFQGRQVAPYLHQLYHGGGQPASGNDTPITPIDGGQLQRLGSTATSTSNSTSTTRRRSTHDAYAPIAGIYTEIEFANSDAWMDAMQSFGRDYIGGIARGVHDLLPPPTPAVWASPYSILNQTRHPVGYNTTPAEYAKGMRTLFDAVGGAGGAGGAGGGGASLDHVAMQDSMGAQGNSFANARDVLSNMTLQVPTWANVEIFEIWPRDCEPSASNQCHGRHPAPFARIKAQLANEAPHADQLIGEDRDRDRTARKD